MVLGWYHWKKNIEQMRRISWRKGAQCACGTHQRVQGSSARCGNPPAGSGLCDHKFSTILKTSRSLPDLINHWFTSWFVALPSLIIICHIDVAGGLSASLLSGDGLWMYSGMVHTFYSFTSLSALTFFTFALLLHSL